MARRVLFIGGTGTVSWWCVGTAQEAGWHVTVVGRGSAKVRPLPAAVDLVRADVTDRAGLAEALAGREFDVVADFLTYDVDRLRANVDLFEGRTGQYVFISTASAYLKPVVSVPVVESTPLANPFWEYSRKKAACEGYLMGQFQDHGFPATVVRPSHTYDAASHVLLGGWTDVARMREGLPVVVQGDGTSLWTLTHGSDFAYCFQRLLGERRALGEAFHITSDEVLAWDAIYREVAAAAGVREPSLVHVASETIAKIQPDLYGPLVGDRANCAVFDNTKVRRLAPGFVQQVTWAQGARQYVEFHDAHQDWAARSPEWDALSDRLAALA
jgi:nucleoside-diphosphate-sugar epimerase